MQLYICSVKIFFNIYLEEKNMSDNYYYELSKLL